MLPQVRWSPPSATLGYLATGKQQRSNVQHTSLHAPQGPKFSRASNPLPPRKSQHPCQLQESSWVCSIRLMTLCSGLECLSWLQQQPQTQLQHCPIYHGNKGSEALAENTDLIFAEEWSAAPTLGNKPVASTESAAQPLGEQCPLGLAEAPSSILWGRSPSPWCTHYFAQPCPPQHHKTCWVPHWHSEQWHLPASIPVEMLPTSASTNIAFSFLLSQKLTEQVAKPTAIAALLGRAVTWRQQLLHPAQLAQPEPENKTIPQGFHVHKPTVGRKESLLAPFSKQETLNWGD